VQAVRSDIKLMHRPCWVLAADDPAALASFYGTLCGIDPGSGDGVRVLQLPGAGSLMLYRPSRQRPQPAQHGRLALCLRVERLEAAQDQALGLGAAVLEPMRQEPFGREVWLTDPEGNRLLLLETIPQYTPGP